MSPPPPPGRYGAVERTAGTRRQRARSV